MMDKKVGFIGLGIMGTPMSINLVKAGYKVTVWNRTPSRMNDLVSAGADIAKSAAEATEGSEVTITMLTDSPAVEEVILGPAGVIKGAKPGSVIIDMSTISPSVTKSIASEIHENNAHMLDAPVSGGVPGAINATLSIMVGGEAPVFQQCLPILQAMGSRITHCGGNGMGQVTKLANQIVGQGNLAALCEGLIFAVRAGVNPESLTTVLSGGAANSWMVENIAPRILEGDFNPGFMVKLAHKDMRLVQETASELDVPLFTTPLVTQIFRAAEIAGFGEEGTQAYIKILEMLSNTEARAGNSK